VIRGDQATVTVLVEVPPEVAFRLFTEEIDAWWGRTPRFRLGGALRLEAGVGGKLVETTATRTHEIGTVLAWEPPARLVLAWRVVNFAPGERTEVEVLFAPSPSGTRVTVTHRGWAGIRGDHPVRHGQEPGPFLREMGRWWGELMTSLRETALRTRA
jgi:uncharacterized protein YndB with AHSA1/START domain